MTVSIQISELLLFRLLHRFLLIGQSVVSGVDHELELSRDQSQRDSLLLSLSVVINKQVVVIRISWNQRVFSYRPLKLAISKLLTLNSVVARLPFTGRYY